MCTDWLPCVHGSQCSVCSARLAAFQHRAQDPYTAGSRNSWSCRGRHHRNACIRQEWRWRGGVRQPEAALHWRAGELSYMQRLQAQQMPKLLIHALPCQQAPMRSLLHVRHQPPVDGHALGGAGSKLSPLLELLRCVTEGGRQSVPRWWRRRLALAQTGFCRVVCSCRARALPLPQGSPKRSRAWSGHHGRP